MSAATNRQIFRAMPEKAITFVYVKPSSSAKPIEKNEVSMIKAGVPTCSGYES